MEHSLFKQFTLPFGPKNPDLIIWQGRCTDWQRSALAEVDTLEQARRRLAVVLQPDTTFNAAHNQEVRRASAQRARTQQETTQALRRTRRRLDVNELTAIVDRLDEEEEEGEVGEPAVDAD